MDLLEKLPTNQYYQYIENFVQYNIILQRYKTMVDQFKNLGKRYIYFDLDNTTEEDIKRLNLEISIDIINILLDLYENSTYYEIFYSNHLVPVLENTANKLKGNSINYFSEDLISDTLYIALTRFFTTKLSRNIVDKTMKEVLKKCNKINVYVKKYECFTDYYCSLDELIKYCNSDKINSPIFTTDYYDKNKMCINFVTELTTNTNLYRITKYLIIQTLIKYFSVKYIHSMDFVENTSLEQLIVDVKGFFVRNAKSLAENTKSFMNLKESNTIQDALIYIKNTDMLMNLTKEYTSTTESERFNGMWKAIGLINSLRRTSNNELAELNFNIEELQNEYFEPMTTKRIEEKDKDDNIVGYHYDPDSLRFIIFNTIDDFVTKWVKNGPNISKKIESNFVKKIIEYLNKYIFCDQISTENKILLPNITNIKLTDVPKLPKLDSIKFSKDIIEATGSKYQELVEDMFNMLTILRDYYTQYRMFYYFFIEKVNQWISKVIGKYKAYINFDPIGQLYYYSMSDEQPFSVYNFGINDVKI